ncbi:helix-turn-helix domain-containing protein [Candidatus Shapirobacteria bacterium]|nr:helix-turn-helix domain-containing protein [Candidatus Shapirobacteria bacterium]
MEKASQIFQKTRLRKKISLKKAVKSTKIPRQYLEAIEKDNHQIFPNFDYAQLYVRDYAVFLELSAAKMVGIFRRDWSGEREETANFGLKRKKDFSNFPLFTGSSLLIGGIVFLAAFYLIRQYLVFNSSPFLKVAFSCLPGKIVVEGETSREAAVKVGEDSVLVNDQGKFKKEISSPFGKEIKIVTQSPAGKTREKLLIVDCE